jgi:methyl-accepting chemotaxis protein
MKMFRHRATREATPRLMTEMGLAEILAESPASLMIADQHGTIVYRNRAASAAAAKMTGDMDESAIRQMRDGLSRIARQASSFPHTEVLCISAAGQQAWAELTVSKLGGGYLANWRVITAERERLALLASTADDLTDAVSSFLKLAADLKHGIGEVSSRADVMASGTEELTISIRDISASTTTAAANTETAVYAADTASERITKLGESSAQIGAFGKLIQTIAEQTNLLALNATIEAARAGETGKGFAVVAGEVKELAQRTSEATGKIAEMIDAIRSDSAGATNSIEEIVRLIHQIESEQTSIAGAVEEQSATAAEINGSMSAVAAATQSSADTVAHLNTTVADLSGKATRLRELL